MTTVVVREIFADIIADALSWMQENMMIMLLVKALNWALKGMFKIYKNSVFPKYFVNNGLERRIAMKRGHPVEWARNFSKECSSSSILNKANDATNQVPCFSCY